MERNAKVGEEKVEKKKGAIARFFEFKIGFWVWYVLFFSVGVMWVMEIYEQWVSENYDAAVNAFFVVFFIFICLLNEMMNEDMRNSLWKMNRISMESMRDAFTHATEAIAVAKEAKDLAVEYEKRASVAEAKLEGYELAKAKPAKKAVTKKTKK